MLQGLLALSTVILMTLGVFGGSLASAYGVSVRKQGWRAFAILTGFALAVDGVAMFAAWIVL